MGFVHQKFIDSPSVYVCSHCHAHIAKCDDLISRTFQGRLGRAYLIESVVNQSLGSPENRLLISGMHTVCNLHCNVCQVVIGWKYLRAHDISQKYKEGRYVLEKSRIQIIDEPNINQGIVVSSPCILEIPPLPMQF